MEAKKEIPLQSEDLIVKARLKWFNAAKGFGFVIPENNPVDAFLHITQLQKHGVYGLGENAEILCRIDYRDKGASVVDVVEILDPGSCSKDTVIFDPEQIGVYKIKGVVKLYDKEKGFCFVTPDDGMKDIFVHKTCLERSEVEELHAGQKVRITFKVAEKGREATEISIERDF